MKWLRRFHRLGAVRRVEDVMLKLLTIAAAFGLFIHGLIHLMGAAVYLKLATIEGLPYKTTLLNGHLDLGERGMGVFGVLWVLPAAGFVVAAVAFFQGWFWWRPFLLTTTLVSLVLTGLDWDTAYAGGILNILILALVAYGPRLAGWL
jgi:hypothetical protein